MKTILVDAVYAFVMEKSGGFKIFKEMHSLLESYPNRKIILTGANDEQFKIFGLKSAESVGIKTYHYDNDKKDLAGLKKFLGKNDSRAV